MAKPRLFIGSASESLAIVDALETELRGSAEIERWDKDTFRPGRFTLEELSESTREFDFAVFVLGQDDATTSRGSLVPSPRDNVIFEAGLFTSVLGRERVFYVVDQSGTKIPSDWKGLGYLTFDAAKQRPRDKVFDAVLRIREGIAEIGPLGRMGAVAPIAGAWWQFVINSDEGAVLSLMEISLGEDSRPRLEGQAWTGEGDSLARYRSRAADFDAGAATLSYYWIGEHPRINRMPRFFGVGEITFRGEKGSGTLTQGEGWHSKTDQAAVGEALIKSTIYARVAPEEGSIMRGSDEKSRYTLLESKRMLCRTLRRGYPPIPPIDSMP